MKVTHVVGELAPRFIGDGDLHIAQHPFPQDALVERLVARARAVLRLPRHQAGIREHGPQIEFALLSRFAGQDFQEFGAADQFRDGPNAHGRHDLP